MSEDRKKTLDMADEVWTLADLATKLHLPPEKVQKQVVARPGFPAPANSAWPERWRASEVIEYFRTAPEVPAPKKITRSLAHLTARNAQLYRHFDDEGRLLYVGVSMMAVYRTVQHRRNSHWFREVCTITIEHFATRAEALTAEALAIRTEKPLHNIMGAE